jgi:hypothetical protein
MVAIAFYALKVIFCLLAAIFFMFFLYASNEFCAMDKAVEEDDY